MTFTYKVYYRDDSRWNYDKIKTRRVRAKSAKQAMEKFQKKFGIRPTCAV